jgi:hypothetical protein
MNMSRPKTQSIVCIVQLDTISLHLLWIVPLMEVLAVPLVVLLHLATLSDTPKAPWHGWLAGLIATASLLWILNYLLPQMRFQLQGQPLARIPIGMPSFWGGLLLACIFAVQRVLPGHLFSNYWVNSSIQGFVSLVFPTLVVGAAYTVITRWFPFTAITLVAGARIRLRAMNWLPLSLCLGIYEAVAFPVINIWQSMPDHQLLWGALWGGIGGLAGTSATLGLYSSISFFRIKLLLERQEQMVSG